MEELFFIDSVGYVADIQKKGLMRKHVIKYVTCIS